MSKMNTTGAMRLATECNLILPPKKTSLHIHTVQHIENKKKKMCKMNTNGATRLCHRM